MFHQAKHEIVDVDHAITLNVGLIEDTLSLLQGHTCAHEEVRLRHEDLPALVPREMLGFDVLLLKHALYLLPFDLADVTFLRPELFHGPPLCHQGFFDEDRGHDVHQPQVCRHDESNKPDSAKWVHDKHQPHRFSPRGPTPNDRQHCDDGFTQRREEEHRICAGARSAILMVGITNAIGNHENIGCEGDEDQQDREQLEDQQAAEQGCTYAFQHHHKRPERFHAAEDAEQPPQAKDPDHDQVLQEAR
mmetsp:Transcript_115/g.352  ORF Transcript_115/g.352 Transcript_115/m.352 type:complete len:247 (-) Transcript_115:222-962(-)